ncbi:MAG: alpha/beta fold hydrolase [Chitinophagaceae bacterium]|nr:MAG: alpha/beta fold hydrolase [Chitinophagaceae bacterium]
MKFLKWLAIVMLVLIVAYFAGPKPAAVKLSPSLPVVPAIGALPQWIATQESTHKLKPDNEARIIWADSSRRQTEFSVIYLHGFSASQEEGDPVHTDFARKIGANLFLARLSDHGIDTTEPLLGFTADRVWESAKEAYAIGKQLGRKVIIIGTSTGGTLALKLAATFPEIHSLVLLSPNIAINDPNAWILNNHWGLQVAHLVKGEYNTSSDTTAVYRQYWNSKYRMEAAVQLEELLEKTMKASVFGKVNQPVLLLYYYKNENEQDDVVKVSAMLRMFRQLGTAPAEKKELALPATGNHVIGSWIKSKDLPAVEKAMDDFAIQVLKIRS